MPRLILLLLSFAAELKTTDSRPAYYADRANVPVIPLAARLEFSVPESVSVVGGSVAFQIETQRIDTIQYSGSSWAAQVPGEQLRLLTIGFFDETNRHHNAVLQLRADTWKQTLLELERRTGLKLGAEPKKVLLSSKK